MRAEYAVALAISGIVTFAVTPLVRRLALRRRLLVVPGDRSVHERPTANIGGAAMFAGLLAGLLVAWLSGDLVDVFQSPSAPFGVAAAATVIATLFQVLGIVLVENGVALAALELPGTASFVIELGVALDLVLIAVVAVVFHERIFAEFGSGDTAVLESLRD